MKLRKTISKIFGLILILAVLYGVQALMGGRFGQILQITSFVGVAGLTFAFAARNVGIRTAARAFALALIGATDKDADDPLLREFSDAVPGWSMMSAQIMAVIGLIQVMNQLNDPSKIGEGIAVAFVSYVYGPILAGVLPLFPVVTPTSASAKRVRPADAFASFAMLLLSFFVVMYAITQADISSLKKAVSAAGSKLHSEQEMQRRDVSRPS